VVVALGKIAFDAWLRVRTERGGALPAPRPRFAHGVLVQMKASADGGASFLLGCYHPSRQNTHTGRLTPAMLDAVLKRARTLLK
jgi:uracil-DNA glycosylase